MGPLEALERALASYARFDGRARRSEFWWFFCACFLAVGAVLGLGCLTLLLGLVVGGDPGLVITGYGAYLLAVSFALNVALLPPYYAVSVRRLHDTGRSGLWQLAVLVPYAGVLLYWFWSEDGQPGPNRFGPDQKDRATPPPWATPLWAVRPTTGIRALGRYPVRPLVLR